MASESGTALENEDVVRLSADIVAAFLTYNAAAPGAIPDLIRTVHGAVSALAAGAEAAPQVSQEKQKPAVPVSRSVTPTHIICLEDGARLKMLKRYLRSKYGMTPDDYRRKWGLPPDYPMVAPEYAARRSAFAKQIGLGRGVRRGGDADEG